MLTHLDFDHAGGLDDFPQAAVHLLVPLRGHTFGHPGIAIEKPDGYLLHCGDAYFHRGEVDRKGYHCPPGCARIRS